MGAGMGVRKATDADTRPLAGVLARAFADDPAFSWAVPDAKRRRRHGPRYFELTLGVYLPKGEVYTTEDSQGAAIWAPPERWQTSATSVIPFVPTIVRLSGRHTLRTMRMLSMMEAEHKKRTEPHYYLPFIGTDPSSRGKGYGSALLIHMLRRCDEEGVPAYLEATSMRNQALYHRHAFKAFDELRWPGNGPSWWPMWREPRSP